MTAPFAHRQITPIFRLGQGNFQGSGGFNTLTISGLRCVVQVEFATLPAVPTAVIQIFGLTLNQINDISKAGLVWQYKNNQIAINAGDDLSGQFQIFNGWIQQAYLDGTNPPDVFFTVIANAGEGIQLPAVNPITFKGSTSVETALKQIIQPAGLTLENNGVDVTLLNPYFPGTVMQQINSICKAADCFSYIDNIKKTLAIWPKNGSRTNHQVFIVSPNTGMIGYPSFETVQIKVRTRFDPGIHGPNAANPGLVMNVQSSLTAANGNWSITQVSYNLSSELPGGPWEMMITGISAQGI